MKLFATTIIAIACSAALPIGGRQAVSAAIKTPFRVSPLTLTATGLVVPGSRGPQNLRFGTLRAKAIQIVSGALGAPTKTGVDPECGGDHPIAYADFRSGIQLSFVGGKLVGWTIQYGGDKRHLTADGVGIGITVARLQKLLPDVFIDPGNEEGGGIGPGFSADKSPSGWLDGTMQTSKVMSLYAGETCIVE